MFLIKTKKFEKKFIYYNWYFVKIKFNHVSRGWLMLIPTFRSWNKNTRKQYILSKIVSIKLSFLSLLVAPHWHENVCCSSSLCMHVIGSYNTKLYTCTGESVRRSKVAESYTTHPSSLCLTSCWLCNASIVKCVWLENPSWIPNVWSAHFTSLSPCILTHTYIYIYKRTYINIQYQLLEGKIDWSRRIWKKISTILAMKCSLTIFFFS